MASLPRTFHPAEEQLSPAPLVRRLLAMLYDGLICFALLLVTTLIYTLISAWIVGVERYKILSESGATGSDPLLTSFLFCHIIRLLRLFLDP